MSYGLIKWRDQTCARKLRNLWIFKKPPPRPIVALPVASQFQEIVAMDLKQHNEKIPIHLINLVAHLSAAADIPNKNRETVIKKTFEIAVFVYGKPQKFLTDIRGEFANAYLFEMVEQQKLM